MGKRLVAITCIVGFLLVASAMPLLGEDINVGSYGRIDMHNYAKIFPYRNGGLGVRVNSGIDSLTSSWGSTDCGYGHTSVTTEGTAGHDVHIPVGNSGYINLWGAVGMVNHSEVTVW